LLFQLAWWQHRFDVTPVNADRHRQLLTGYKLVSWWWSSERH